MGQHMTTNTGYGIVVLLNENEGKNLPDELDTPLVTAFIGDGVLGEDEGFFFMSRDVMIDMSSSNYVSEWIDQYPKFQVSPDLANATQKLADELTNEGIVLYIGAFKVSDFG